MLRLAFALAAFIVPVKTAGAAQTVHPRGRVIASAAEIAYPPFSIVDKQGNTTGFSVELLRATLTAMGNDVTFRTGPWPEVRGWLEEGEIDALPLVGRTPERELRFDFTVPYMSIHGAIVVRKDTADIQTLEDLKGCQVAVMRGDNAEEFLRRKDRGIDIVTTDTFEAALEQLSAGRHDAVVIQRLVALRLIKENGLTGLTVVNKPIEGFRQDFCFAVREGDRETLALLNEGLATVMADGTYRHLYAKWFAALQLPATRRIVIGGDDNFPPFEYLDEKGHPAGFNVELTRAIADTVGLDVEIRLAPWPRIKADLQSGEIDALQGMFYSTTRDLKYDFTTPHLIVDYVGVVRRDSGMPPEVQKDLVGRRLAVEKGDIAHDYLLKNGLTQQSAALAAQEDALRGVFKGEYDVALVARLTALSFIERNGWDDLVVGRKPLLSLEYCYAARPDQKALLARLSEGLKALEASGEYRRIREKWVGLYPETAPSYGDALHTLALVIAPFLTIFLLVVLWSWSLRRQVARQTKQLRESEKRFRSLVEGAPDAIFIQTNARFAYVNQAGVALLKADSAADLLGKPILEHFHPDDHEPVRRRIQRLNEGRRPVPARVESMIAPDGEEIPVEVAAVPFDFKGCHGALVFARDIRDRIQAKDELEASEAQYRLLAENTLDVIWTMDFDLSFTYVNPAIEQLTGYSPGEWVGSHLQDHCNEARFAEMAEVIREEIAKGPNNHGVVFETEFRRRDGSALPVEIHGKVIYDHEGTLAMLQGVTRDISERKNAEAALRRSEQRLRTLVDTIPDLVWLKDEDGVYLSCNPTFERFFGAREADILGKTDYDFVDRELADFFREHDRRAMAVGRPSVNEEALTFATDGYQGTFETVKTPMYDEDGTLIGVLGIARDITRRKQAEETRQRQERLLREMGSIAKVGGWEFDPASGEGTWTEEVARIHDLDPGRETSLELGLSFYPGASRSKIEAAINAAISFGQSYDLELEFVSAKGIRKWVRTIGEPKIDDGRVVQVRGSFQDITASKRAEQRIAHLNRVLQTLLDLNHLIVRERDPAALIREGGRLLTAHRGYGSALIALTDKDEMPVSWAIAGLASSAPGLERQLERGELPPCFDRVRHTKETVEIDDMRGFCGSCPVATRCDATHALCSRLVHDGTTYGYMVVALDQRLGADGEERRLFDELARDLSFALSVLKGEEKRRSLESQLIQAQRMESVGRLAGGVAHDFNNILSVIIGYAELAIDDIGPEAPLFEDLKEIVDAGKRSRNITRQLLAFARQETIAPEVLDLNETVENLLKMLRRLIGEDIDLAWQPAADVWPVHMDPSQVDQILANLCVNARDAIKDVGKVTIETGNAAIDDAYCGDHPGFLPGDFVCLAVSDDGCGMDRETADKIFEPFFTTKDIGRGTGLGLATVYGIVKQNEGFINLYSEPGKGTSFRIYLPRHGGGVADDRRPIGEETLLGRGETVLVVEDDPAILKLTERILSSLKYRVIPARLPSEAIEQARVHAGDIQLLVTDVVMPGMNGRELAGKLTKIHPDMKTLYMSGYTADVIAHRGVLDSAIHFIHKPFSKPELASKVRETLDDAVQPTI